MKRISKHSMEKKDIFAPLALGLGATRRAAVLLLVMMLTTVTAWAQSGSCGYNVTWELTQHEYDNFYTLTISGSGAMYDYGYVMNLAPWSYAEQINEVVIENGVTSIGAYAFSHCNVLESVTFAEGSQLESIGECAFSNTALTSVEIPASVTSIGNYAFYTTRLTSVEIPASVTSIGVEAFLSCDKLESVTFAEVSQLTSIGDRAFSNTALTSIEIPASVTSIGEDVFQDCSYLATVTVYAPSCSLGDNAFSNCNHLANIYVFSDLVDGYKAAENWSAYAGKITALPTVTTSYVDASGTLHDGVEAVPLNNAMTTLAAGTYVVNSDVAYTSGITTTGDVTLILGDGCTMSFGKEGALLNATIIDCNNHNLTIYGQSGGTGWLKAYSATGSGINAVYDYQQYSGNVFIRRNSAYCIDANNSVALFGGTLDVESGGSVNGDISGGSISILGGKLWARFKGLWSPQGITLGYTNTTDQIYVKVYHADGMGLKIADGKTLVDDHGEIWSGTLDNNQIEHGINGRTLKPLDYTGVTLTKEYNNVSATFSGLSETTVSIPVDVNVTSVTYERTFTDGRPATVMLPFSKSVSDISGGTFYTFGGVEKENNKWEATMNEVTGSLTANTPYLFVPTGTSLTFTGGATLNTTGGGNCLASDAEGWEFHGTYSKKLWDEVVTHDYGFAALSGTSVDGQDVEAGQFVRLTAGASAKPMRCYLSYVSTEDAAPVKAYAPATAGADDDLPKSITVRLINRGGDVDAIGTVNMETGEMSFDGWYTIDGVRLESKPTQKGLYINNGKKVILK